MADETGWLRREDRSGGFVLQAGGHWNVFNSGRLDGELLALKPASGQRVSIDVSAVDALDTTGAWLLHRTMNALRAGGAEVSLHGARGPQLALIERVAESYRACATEPARGNALVACVERVGRASVWAWQTALGFLSFFGEVVAVTVRTLFRPLHMRFTSTVFHMEQVGLNALPIVALISFLIGVVMAYQGAVQLERFGAQVFVVNLLAVSILRELGILLTAIVVAGRSGSAFTAQLGSMKVHEEVDALRTLGLNVVEVLVLPRVFALVLTLPLLAFTADIMGLLGGGLVCWAGLDISPTVFLERLQGAIRMWSFWVGIIKAPVFALLVGVVSCYEGLQVAGSAESLGDHTTRSVVESIFLVIVADALFSILFSAIGI